MTALRGGPSQRKLVIEGVSQKVKSCPALFLTLLSHHGLTDFATEHAHHHDAVSSLMETGDYDWNLSDTWPQINPSWFWACISQVFGTQMKGLPRTLWINTIYMNLTAFFKPLHLSFNLGEKKRHLRSWLWLWQYISLIAFCETISKRCLLLHSEMYSYFVLTLFLWLIFKSNYPTSCPCFKIAFG